MHQSNLIEPLVRSHVFEIYNQDHQLNTIKTYQIKDQTAFRNSLLHQNDFMQLLNHQRHVTLSTLIDNLSILSIEMPDQFNHLQGLRLIDQRLA